ncbi:MAG: hypothetical protein ACRC0L_00255 [Angustibacter sp.]
MRKSSVVIAALVLGALSTMGPSAQAASQDIPEFWNSGDRDAAARFAATGEIFHLAKWNSGSAYIDWKANGTSGRLRIDESGYRRRSFDLSFPEGVSVAMRVCEEKNVVADDCSGWKYGLA